MRVAGFFGAGENMRWSIAARKAASVLPEPVGARTRTLSPSAIAGQASSWARVGDWKVASNHARVAGLKLASGSLPTNTEGSAPTVTLWAIDPKFALVQGRRSADRRPPSRQMPGCSGTNDDFAREKRASPRIDDAGVIHQRERVDVAEAKTKIGHDEYVC